MRDNKLEAGHRFGRLIVIREAAAKGKNRGWLCLCDCGESSEVAQDALRLGRTMSCGCLKADGDELRRLKFNAKRADATAEARREYWLKLWEATGSVYDADDSRRVQGLIRKDLAIAGFMADGMSSTDSDKDYDSCDGGAIARIIYGY